MPVNGATVTIDPVSATPRTTTTLSDGRYYFVDVSSAVHSLAATASGFVDGSITASVGSNVTADAPFILKRDP